MKSIIQCRIPILGALAVFGLTTAIGAATVGDNFDDNSKDTTKWGTDTTPPGEFTEENQSVIYRVEVISNPVKGPATRPWILTHLPYDTDWEALVSASAACTCNFIGESIAVGLRLTSDENASDMIEAGQAGSRTGFFTSERHVFSYIITGGITNGFAQFDTGITNTSWVNLSFDSATKVLTVSTTPDLGVTNNLNFTPLASYGLAGSGGGSANVNWGLTSTSTFSIALLAIANSEVSSAQSAFDNFSLTVFTPPNLAPVASNDVYSTAQNTPLNVSAPGVLGNDTDPESDPLNAVLVDNPGHSSSFTLYSNGSFDYTPSIGFAGIDSFTYRADDGTDVSALATVYLSVGAATATGSVVVVELDATPLGVNPITLTFSNVTAAGSTSVMPLDPSEAGTVPGSYSIFSNLVFDLSTTASITGDVDVCFTLTGSISSNTFAMLRVLHNEGGILVDRTILPPDSPAPDFATKTLCARVSSLSPFAIALFDSGPPLPDLTVAITNADFTCTNTTKGTICTSAGTWTFSNNATEYGSATFNLTTTKQEKPGKPPKWKLAGSLNVNSFSHGANPASLVQVHLSDDATLDGADTPLLKKPVSTAALEAAIAKGKAVKVKLGVPKGVDLTGKHLIIEVDATDPKTGTDAVTESDETNNTAAFGPLP
jgi:hypothetical protein